MYRQRYEEDDDYEPDWVSYQEEIPFEFKIFDKEKLRIQLKEMPTKK